METCSLQFVLTELASASGVLPREEVNWDGYLQPDWIQSGGKDAAPKKGETTQEVRFPVLLFTSFFFWQAIP
jgi:hypothetical protein